MTIDLEKLLKSKTVWAGLAVLLGWINQHVPQEWGIAIRIGTEIYPLQDLTLAAIPVIFWGRATAKGPLVGKESENA